MRLLNEGLHFALLIFIAIIAIQTLEKDLFHYLCCPQYFVRSCQVGFFVPRHIYYKLYYKIYNNF